MSSDTLESIGVVATFALVVGIVFGGVFWIITSSNQEAAQNCEQNVKLMGNRVTDHKMVGYTYCMVVIDNKLQEIK